MIPSLQLTPICRLKLGQFLQDWKLRTLNCIKTACLYTLLLLNIQQRKQQMPFWWFFLKYFIFRLLRCFHRNDESMLLRYTVLYWFIDCCSSISATTYLLLYIIIAFQSKPLQLIEAQMVEVCINGFLVVKMFLCSWYGHGNP